MFLKKKNKTASFFHTIKFRLTAGYVCVLFVSLIAMTYYLYHGLTFTLSKEIATFLDIECAHMVPFVTQHYDQRNLIINELNQRTALAEGTHALFYALFDGEGNILAKTETFAEDAEAIQSLKEKISAGGHAVAIGTQTKRVGYGGAGEQIISRVVMYEGAPIFYLQFGVDLTYVERILSKYWLTVFLAVPVVLLIAALGGYFMAKRYLQPIIHITEAARDISLSHEAMTYLPLRHTGDELDWLAETFNAVFEKLAVSYRKIAQFTADASHEMRIPITTLKGEAAVVLERERDCAEYRRVLESSIEEYDRLSQMLNDLLTLSRSDLGVDAIEFECVELGSLLSHLCEFMQVLADTKGIALNFSIEGTIYIDGNKIMLERLFSNLLDNAIKYTQHAQSVDISVEKKDGKCVVSVEDYGVGIPEDALPLVFDRFYRVDKARAREHGGTGLGLPICKMIVDAHSGAIAVHSQVGKGTCVRMNFPLA